MTMAKNKKKNVNGKEKKTKQASRSRKVARILTLATVLLLVALCSVGTWYVRHPADWLAKHQSFLTAPLVYFGNRTAFLTDALGWTGHDAVYDFDDPIPEGQVFFGGQPQRVGAPAPADIMVLQRETGSALVFASFLLVFYRQGMSGYVLLMGLAAVALFILSIRFGAVPL